MSRNDTFCTGSRKIPLNTKSERKYTSFLNTSGKYTPNKIYKDQRLKKKT